MSKPHGSPVTPVLPVSASESNRRRPSGHRHGMNEMSNVAMANDVSDEMGHNDPAIENICLPPQLSPSKWQSRGTTERCTVDVNKTFEAWAMPEKKSRPRRASLAIRTSISLSKLGLSNAEIQTEIENDTLELVRELVEMPRTARARAIRSLAVNCAQKREIRQRVQQAKLSKSSVKRTCCTDCLEQVSLSFRRFRQNVTSLSGHLALWHGSLKKIGGHFGSAALGYFVFLKWLLVFNVFLLVLNLSFLAVPQILHQSNTTLTNSTFQGLELLTGAGYFERTVLFYGGYEKPMDAGPYNMQLAYLTTMVTYMMLCGLVIVYKLGQSVSGSTTDGAWRLLCIWDFSIHSEKAVQNLQKKLFIQVKESLWECRERTQPTTLDRLRDVSIHMAAWLLYTGLTVLACTAVYFLSIYNMQIIKVALSGRDLRSEAFLLWLPLLVAFINLATPLFCSLVARLEPYSNPRLKVYTGMFRDVLLKVSILGILCYYWLTKVPSNISCWESFVGQDVYRLAVADFIFSILGCVSVEHVGSLIGTRCLKGVRPSEFDITRNILDLTYAQTLVWVGVYFSPLLPIIQIVKLFIMFYMKKVSLRLIGQCSTRPALAAELRTVFVAVLFFPFYMGSVAMLAYVVWRPKPSAQCGPFRGLNTSRDALALWMKDRVASPYTFAIQGQLLLLLLSAFMLISLHFLWQVVQDRKRLISSLHEQIVNEGKDRAFLLEQLRRVQGESGRPQVHFQQERRQGASRASSSKGPQGTPSPKGAPKPGPASSRPAEEQRKAAPASRPLTPARGAPPPRSRPPAAATPVVPFQPSEPSPQPRAKSPHGQDAHGPGQGKKSQKECWVDVENMEQPGPGPPPNPVPLWATNSKNPTRYPRLEPIAPRGTLPPLPGALTNSPKLQTQKKPKR